MKVFVRKGVFVICMLALLCLPATAWAVPLAPVPNLEPAETPHLETNDPKLATDDLGLETTYAPYLSKDAASPDKELLVSIGASSGIKLTPGAIYQIYIGETLVKEHHADQNGQLFTQIKIPPALTGPQTLKVTSKDLTLQKPLKIL